MVVTAVCFDLYGTLVSTAVSVTTDRIFDELGLLGPVGIRALDLLLTKEFESMSDFAQILSRTLSNSEYYDALLIDDLRAVSPFPETTDVLTRLTERRISLAVLSNASTPYKSRFFELPLPRTLFKELLFSCEEGIKKPDKAFFEMAARKLGRSPSEILMVGDNFNDDVLAARRAGMQALHIDRTLPAIPGERISSLEGVLGYVA